MCRFAPRLAVLIPVVCALLELSPASGAAPVDRRKPSPAGNADLHAYHSANGLLNRSMFDLAATEYRHFLDAHPRHEKAPSARYGLAVCLFRLGKLDQALPQLTRLQEADHCGYPAEVATMLGQCHLADRDYEKAAEAFQSVVGKHQDHALADDAAAQLVESLYHHGRHQDAATSAADFGCRWPDSPHRDRADYFGGLALMARQAHKLAAGNFADLLKLHPKSPFAAHAGLLLARCHQQGDDLESAGKGYRKVLRQADHSFRPDALLGLATILHQQHRGQAAGKLLDELLEKHEASPPAPAGRLLRGRVWFDLGEYEPAARAFGKIVQDKGPLAADAAYWSAKCKLRLEDFDDAAGDLKRAINRYPESHLLPEMCYDRAIALLRGNKQKKAAKELSAFRSRFPRHALAPDALHILATIAHQRQDYEASLEHARTFKDSYADHALMPKIAFLTAENAYLSGDHEKAAEEYRRFLDKHGSDEQARTAGYRLGMSLYRQDKLEEARRLLSEIDAGDAGPEEFPAKNMALGDIHFRLQEWEQAARRLSDYLAAGLDVAAADDALLKLGIALQRQEHYEEAARQYDRLLERFEKSPHRLQAMFERGQALVASGRFDEAAEAFAKLIALDDDSRFAAPAHEHLASISLRGGDLKEAAKRFAKVAKAGRGTGKEADALFQQGRALITAGEFAAAEKVLQRLLERFPSHGRLETAKANLAIARGRQDRHQAALELLEQVDLSSLAPDLATAVQYEKAWCLRELGKDDDAASAYRTLLEAKAGGELQAHALLDLANIEAARERHEEAVKLLRRLQEAGKRSETSLAPALQEEAAYRLGTSLFEVGKHDQAAETLGEFVTAYPQSKLLISASFFCGEALFQIGEHGRAIEHLERVAAGPKTDPASGPSLLRLGECYASRQRWAKSEEAFTEYLDRFEKNQQWYQAEFGAGWARENQGRFDEAIAAYQRVVGRHKGPTAARAQFQIGQCLFAKKSYQDAVRELLKVDILYAYPQWSAAALYEAGRCFEKLARNGEARQQFKTVVEKYGDTRWAALASQRVAAAPEGLPPGR